MEHDEAIRRAVDAIDKAPRTESGIIIPPHVAAEKQAVRDTAERNEMIGPRPNRAQRRAWEKLKRQSDRAKARAAKRAEQ